MGVNEDAFIISTWQTKHQNTLLHVSQLQPLSHRTAPKSSHVHFYLWPPSLNADSYGIVPLSVHLGSNLAFWQTIGIVVVQSVCLNPDPAIFNTDWWLPLIRDFWEGYGPGPECNMVWLFGMRNVDPWFLRSFSVCCCSSSGPPGWKLRAGGLEETKKEIYGCRAHWVLLVWEKRLQRMEFYGGRWFAATTSSFFFIYSCWSIISSSPTCCPQCWSLLVFFSLYFLVGTHVNWQKGKVYKDSSLTFMSICDSMFDLMVLYFQLGLFWKSPLKIA